MTNSYGVCYAEIVRDDVTIKMGIDALDLVSIFVEEILVELILAFIEFLEWIFCLCNVLDSGIRSPRLIYIPFQSLSLITNCHEL